MMVLTTQPWFDPARYAWIPGSAYGVAAALMGGLVSWLAPRGRARNFTLTAWFVLWAVAVALLIAGFVALARGQPWGVWYGLLLTGAIGTLVVGANSFVVVKAYRLGEQRRLAAKDLL
jgi:MFS family permease